MSFIARGLVPTGLERTKVSPRLFGGVGRGEKKSLIDRDWEACRGESGTSNRGDYELSPAVPLLNISADLLLKVGVADA